MEKFYFYEDSTQPEHFSEENEDKIIENILF